MAKESVGYRILDHGYLAVDFFFVLSGFIIFFNYYRSFQTITWRGVANFLVKRIARIYPLHLAIMLLFVINPLAILLLSSAGELGGRYDLDYYVASLLLIQNWGIFDAVEWNIPAWSISTEFGAYLLFPLMATLVNRRVHSTWMHMLLIVVLCAAIALLFSTAGYTSLGNGIPDIGLARCILEFAIGVLTASLFVAIRGTHSKVTGWLPVPLVAVIVSGIASQSPDYIFCPLAFVILVIYFASSPEWAYPVLGKGVLFFLGEISYSTYLVHYLIKDWVKFPSAHIGLLQFGMYIAVVFAASVVLYRYIEVPGRAWVRTRFSTK